jgi:hypothetical protein
MTSHAFLYTLVAIALVSVAAPARADGGWYNTNLTNQRRIQMREEAAREAAARERSERGRKREPFQKIDPATAPKPEEEGESELARAAHPTLLTRPHLSVPRRSLLSK